MTTETTETQRTQLAGVRVPCPPCDALGGWTRETSRPEGVWNVCGDCEGTGLVYMFAEGTVRVWCSLTGIIMNDTFCAWVDQCKHGDGCKCQGRGWTASQDGWVWWRAVTVIVSSKQCVELTHTMLAQAPEAAFFAALWQMVDKYPGKVFDA